MSKQASMYWQSGIVGLLVVVSACTQSPATTLPEPAIAVHAAATCDGPEETRYFPETASQTVAIGGDGRFGLIRLPVQLLDAMHESPLACGDAPESYRITWVHSFSGWPRDQSEYPPTMIRVSKEALGWTAVGVKVSSAFNRTEIERRSRALNDAEVQQMRKAVEGFQLWVQPYYHAETPASDGAMWIVEGRRSSAYHEVLNADEDSVRRLALVFARLAGINPGHMDSGQ